MRYVFAEQETPEVNVAVLGDHFPVHRTFCVVQDYSKHFREMGANLQREVPFFQQTRRCSLH